MLRRLTVPLFAALAVLAVPASAAAKKVNVVVGVGDQNTTMFSNPFYQQLGVKRTRYFVHWNAIDNPGELARADAFVKAAKQTGIKVLMHLSSNDLRMKKGTLPSANKYKLKAKQLVARYKAQGVKDWGVWNEANHNTQETYNNPKRAAQFYKKFRQISCSGCKVVALDVLDQAGVASYIKRWLKAAGSAGRKARVFGIHNYSEVNRKASQIGGKKYPGTRKIISAVRKKNKKARYWYTETGALVKFASFGCSQTRPVTAIKRMFSLAKKYDKYIERLYSYNWTGADCNVRFDAGLVFANGEPRPVYHTYKSKLANFKK